MRFKKGDKVFVDAGKDRGKSGKIVGSMPRDNKVIVEGVNVIKKAVKASGKNPGGIIEKSAPVNVSNVRLICPHCNKATRIGVKFLKDGKKERYCKKCNEGIKE